jgi:hypothetical protein
LYPQDQKINDLSFEIEAPKIPFDPQRAFYPLRRNKEGKVIASYQWRECAKRFIWCTKWETKRIEFNDLEWFYLNGFGLTKRKAPSLIK